MSMFKEGEEYTINLEYETIKYCFQRRTKCFLYFMIVECDSQASMFEIEKVKKHITNNGDEYCKLWGRIITPLGNTRL